MYLFTPSAWCLMTSSYLLCIVSLLHCRFGICDVIRANKVYCVISKNTTNLGCQGYDFVEQNTFTHYLSHSSEYFNSYEKYLFQSGNHTILSPGHFKVLIQGVTNLTLTGLRRTNSSGRAFIDYSGTATSFQFNYS